MSINFEIFMQIEKLFSSQASRRRGQQNQTKLFISGWWWRWGQVYLLAFEDTQRFVEFYERFVNKTKNNRKKLTNRYQSKNRKECFFLFSRIVLKTSPTTFESICCSVFCFDYSSMFTFPIGRLRLSLILKHPTLKIHPLASSLHKRWKACFKLD